MFYRMEQVILENCYVTAKQSIQYILYRILLAPFEIKGESSCHPETWICPIRNIMHTAVITLHYSF